MVKVVLVSLTLLLSSLILSCGSGLEGLTTEENNEPTDDQLYRLNSIGDATFDTGCVNRNENDSMRIIAEFTYNPTASLYKITQTKYSGLDCNEVDKLLLTEDTLTLNMRPQDRRAILSIGEDETEVVASLGIYIYSSQMLTILDDKSGYGAGYLDELKTTYPEYYPKSLTLGTKMDMSGKPFLWDIIYSANGSTNYAILYFDDEKMAASGSDITDPLNASIVHPLEVVLYKISE
jgi:hypothetical protein